MIKDQLTITVTEQGQVNVSGPLENKIFCYGLLKIAEQVIEAYQPKKIVVPSLVPPKSLGSN